MPKEHRKRGKKHKKSEKQDEYAQYENQAPENQAVELQNDGAPSWIRPAQETSEFNPEAPFGYVDADVKAYFRTVDTQMRDWQESRDAEEENEDANPGEERRMFFVAALNEMRGKERQLATDPDCSVVLERMLHSMDDFVRRVFFDSLTGSFEILSKHRFASHVVQTLFDLAAPTASREVRGILPSVPENSEDGELRTMTQLVLDACEEVLPVLPALIIDPFGSHVLRAILLLLSPAASAREDDHHGSVRSKRSSSWKAKQGAMKSLFEEKGKGKADSLRSVPPQFMEMARRFVRTLHSAMDGNEVRVLGASNVAGPCLKIFLEIEADENMGDVSDSLMDRVLAGIITAYKSDSEPEASDYVGTLLRDPTSSHLLETMVSRSPERAFRFAWKLYFVGKLARLGAHPVANFVVAKALERVSPEQLSEAYEELQGIWHRSIQTARTGVLRAFVERAAALGVMKSEVSDSIYRAFGFDADGDKRHLIPCILTVLTKSDYESALQAKKNKPAPPPEIHLRKFGRGAQKETDPLQYKVQGSILLQTLFKMPESHNKFILDAIRDLLVEEKIAIGHDATGSRIYDALLESSTVPARTKREFIMGFIGHYHELVDDRIGSRVGDRCWASSDTYLKEKIARSLIPYESQLSGSFYGKFFGRNLNLYLLQRKPDEWRNMQSQKKQQQITGSSQPPERPTQPQHRKPVAEAPTTAERTSKKRSKPADEIEELFDKALGRKVKKAALEEGAGAPHTTTQVESVIEPEDKKKKKKGKKDETGLDAVFGAIKSAPKYDSERPKKKQKKVHREAGR